MITNDREHPYLIAEIGINHNADIQIVKKLIDASFACGWDCVKFQKRNPDECVPEEQKNKPKETPWGTMTYLDYKKKMELNRSQYDFINSYCNEKPIAWAASVWDLDSLNFLSIYSNPFIKIPSAMLTDKELITKVSKLQTQVILSTGMSTIPEISRAVDIIHKHNKQPLVLLHCNSSYPAPKDELNLNVIRTLKSCYPGCVIGYSGHEEDVEPSVIAVLLGAKVIERHITISHNLWGTDQKSSLEVVGMDILKKRIYEIPSCLGGYDKIVTKSEIEIKNKLRKK